MPRTASKWLLVAVLTGSALAIAASTAGAAAAFGTPFLHSENAPFGVSYATAAIATGDFDEDGRADLVTANVTDNGSLSVYLGDGSGAFGLAAFLDNNSGSIPSGDLTVGDVDADGHLDVVQVVYHSRLEIFFGDGNGGFVNVDLGSELALGAVRIADLDADGLPDVLVTGTGSTSFYAFRNQGARTLVPMPASAEPGTFRAIDVLDLDGDPYPDVAATDGVGVFVARGQGDGTFESMSEVPFGLGGFETLRTGDLDRDGHEDIVAVGDSGFVAFAYGGPTSEWAIDVRSIAGRPWDLAIGDVNGDGWLDVVTSCESALANYLSVLLATGARSWSPELRTAGGIGGPAPSWTPSWVSTRYRFVLVRADDDTILDVAAMSQVGVTTAIGQGDGRFGADTDFDAGPAPVRAEIGDVDGDGHLDVVVENIGCSEGCAIGVLYGDGDGHLAPPAYLAAPGRFVALADFTGDRQLDFVFATEGGVVKVLASLFGQYIERSVVTTLQPSAIRVAEVNGDTIPDLVLWDGTRAQVALGTAQFGSLLAADVVLSGGTELRGSSFEAADVSGDGKADLVVWQGDAADVWLGDGALGFARVAPSILDSYAAGPLGVHDLGSDGYADLVALACADDEGSEGMLILPGDHTGTFATGFCEITGRRPVDVAFGDFDGDGHDDAAVVNMDSQTLAIAYSGRSTASGFEVGLAGKLRGAPMWIAAGDLNEDGTADVVIPNPTLGTVSVCLGPSGTTTPVLASLVSAEADPDRVRLEWYVAAAVEARLERRSGDQAWRTIASLARDGSGRFRYEDRDVSAGRYGYRLRFAEGVTSDEAWVVVPDRTAFGIASLQPNPAREDFQIAFDLPAAGPASLEVIDVSGRSVARRSLAPTAPGRQMLALGRDARLGPGIYWVVLRQGARRAAHRVAIVR